MARNDPTIYMRIPQSLKDALDAAAAENKRSLTAEVVARLEQSTKQPLASQHAQEDLHSALNAQIGVMRAGLQLTNMAAKFLSVEIPAVRDTMSFPVIEACIATGLSVAPEEGVSPISEESFKSASAALSAFHTIADDLGITRMVASLRKGGATETVDGPDLSVINKNSADH